MTRLSRVLWVVALAVGGAVVAGCGTDDPSSDVVSVRDSAGIRVVENGGGSPPTEWTVADSPVAEIGSSTGAPPDQLFRVHDALRLSDGRIVVANGGTAELRYYTADGQHLQSVGGEGQGPGEFRRLGGLCLLSGDTVVAWDPLNRRASTFGPTGAFGRSFTLDHPGESTLARLVGCRPDGALFAHVSTIVSPGEVDPGRSRGPYTYVRYTPSGALRDTVARVAGDASYLWVAGGGERLFSTDVPLDRRTYRSVGPDGLYVARSHAYDVRVYGPAGDLLRIVRRRGDPPDLRDEHWDSVIGERLSRHEAGARREAWRRRYTEIPVPDRIPLVADMAVDRAGSIWLRRKEPPGAADGPDTWLVFGPGGRLEASLELPGGLEPHDIGRNYVVGGWEDELGVEHVTLLRLERRG